MKNPAIIHLIQAVLLAAACVGSRKTRHLLLPLFLFGSNNMANRPEKQEKSVGNRPGKPAVHFVILEPATEIRS